MIPVKLNPTLELSPEDVEKILNDYIMKNYKYEIDSLDFDIKRTYEGYEMGEHEVVKFNGCKIKLKGMKDA